MRKRIFLLLNLTAVLILFGYGGVAIAGCSVSTTTVNFGSYNVLSASPLNSTGSITVTCTSNSNVALAIGPSPNSGGFNPRKMKLTTGSELLQYNLYTNSTRTIIWGDGTQNTQTVNIRARKNKPMVNTVYGRIPPLQDVVAGSYNETLVVTITW